MAIRLPPYLYTGSNSQALYKHGYFAASDLHTGTEVPRSSSTSEVSVAFFKDKRLTFTDRAFHGPEVVSGVCF